MKSSHSASIDCVFCDDEKISDRLIHESTEARLITAYRNRGKYLIIPKRHYESPAELPNGWWREIKDLVSAIPNLTSYNISLNVGKPAGQTISHLHFWVIPRRGGQPSSGKGMARLIREANQR